VLIQVILIATTLGVLILLLQRRAAARTRAWKKLIMLALAAVAVTSILYPQLTTKVANLVGVGRGTDLVLYLLVAVFLYVTVGFYLRFRDLERQLTVIARRLAIDEAIQRQQEIRLPAVAPED
jgi:small membrane protein